MHHFLVEFIETEIKREHLSVIFVLRMLLVETVRCLWILEKCFVWTKWRQKTNSNELRVIHNYLNNYGNFKEYEEDRAKKNEIIGNLKSEVRTLLSKVSKLEKQADQQGQYSRRNSSRARNQGSKRRNNWWYNYRNNKAKYGYRYCTSRHRKKRQNRPIKRAWRKTTSNYSKVCSI